jgi:hypothetical protein
MRHSKMLFLCLLPAFVGLCGLSKPVAAQTSFPMIGSAFPVSVQRGKTTEVTVYTGGNGGGNIYGAYKALFTGEGIKAEIVPPEKGWPAIDPKTPYTVPNVDQVKMKVTVAPDAPLGVREFRLGTPRHGISSVGVLVVSDEAQVLEKEPNNDTEHAQTVAIPCVVNGRLQDGEDVDTYKFKAEAGQEVTFTAICARLEDKIHDLQTHADPLLILRDATGNEIARNDDYYRADPLLHHKFEKAGEYVVQIRDVSYGGNAHWVYALTITTRPYVVAVQPCAVRPGQSSDIHVIGFNLGGTQAVRLDVPADAPRGVWNAPLKFPNGLSNAVPFLVTDAPQVAGESKAAANDGNRTVTASQAAKAPASLPRLSLPGGVSSHLTAPGEIDRYTFHAKKGEQWTFEVTARRLDSDMDSELKIRDAQGKVLAENDDAIGKDSRLDAFAVPADGDYTVEVRDLTGHAGPTVFYNLEAESVRPDFRLKCDPDRALIGPGNRTAWFVQVERMHGFAGPVTIEAKGLPAGVTATPLTIPPEMGQGVIVLSAAPDAKVDTTAVQVVGTAQVPGADGKPAPLTHVAHPVTEIYIPGGGRGLVEVESEGVSVTEPNNDIEVSASTQQVTLAPGGTAKIDVTIKRRPDYTKPVTLDVRVQHFDVFDNPLPPGVTVDDGASKTLIGEKETTGSITLKAAPDAKPIKDWPIAVLANVSINFVMKVWYAAPPVMLTVTAPPPAKK